MMHPFGSTNSKGGAETMKCMVYTKSVAGDSNFVESRTVPIPRVNDKKGKHRVLIRVHAVGLNPCDAKEVMGDKIPQNWHCIRSWYRSYILHNKIIGFDFSGTVVVGSNDCNNNNNNNNNNCHGFRHGDKVFGTMPPFEGTLAEYILAPIDQICYMPKNLSFQQAAALPLIGLTAYQCMQSIPVKQSSSVLVIGASGGTGHIMIQMAKQCLNAKHVVGICSKRNIEFVRQHCCELIDEIIPYDDDDNTDVITQLEQSKYKPFNVVIDCVSSADERDQKIINYPIQIQERKDTLLTTDYQYRRLGGQCKDWIRAGIELKFGINLWKDNHEKLFWVHFPKSFNELHQIQIWVEENKLKPYISNVYNFTENNIQKAFYDILSRHVQGKVVVEVLPSNNKK